MHRRGCLMYVPGTVLQAVVKWGIFCVNKMIWALNCSLFFKKYFIDCAVTVVLFSPFVSSHPPSPTPSGNPRTIVPTHGSCIQVLWLLNFLYCTRHGYSVSTNLYFLIPSPLHPFPHTPFYLVTIKTLSVSRIVSLFFLFA